MSSRMVIPLALISTSQIVSVAVGAVILLLGLYAMIECVRAIIATERTPGPYLRWWPLLAIGIADVMVGASVVFWLGSPVLELLYLTAGWAVLAGIITIVAAVGRRRLVTGEWLLGLGGAATIVLSGYLFLYPIPGLITVGWFIGSYLFVVFALAAIFFVERRRLKNQHSARG